MTVLKVSKASNPHAVAGAIAGLVRDHGRSVMQAIGAAATNQAVKAIAIARSFMRDEGVDLMTRITFLDVEFGGETRTALRFDIADHKSFPEAEPQPERAARTRRSDPDGQSSAMEPEPDLDADDSTQAGSPATVDSTTKAEEAP